ncbi:DUF2254 domain-containing protein [Pseudoroseicyclus sp. CXY001]|uniref:DUF2254 domain-containing protein n=1 Tax=Pseudoroseicyclus sp. CXY001 TaxID=3242492 RepID=UPI00358DAE65
MATLTGISETVLRKALDLWRTLWVRVVLFGLLALISIGLTQVVSPLLPQEWRAYVGGDSADRLLDIVSNAMLAATIFSLTIMVSVYAFSASQWTPRVHRLIVQDPTTQNTIATFIGAFVYSLVAIILREVRVYSDDAALVLFLLTVVVLILVVLALIRWVLHLQGFGSLDQTARQVEDITARELRKRLDQPCLGGHPLGDLPEGVEPIRTSQAGYIVQIYQDRLNEIAEEADCEIYLPVTPGHFVHLGQPIAYVTCEVTDELTRELREHVVVDDARGYVQDPRLGLIVLGEIGSKALSPGINDSGTAIDVITRVGRILSSFEREEAHTGAPTYPRLHVPALDPEDLVSDGFGAIARDGADRLEVQLRLQDVLTGLMTHAEEGMALAARRVAIREYRRAMLAMSFGPDRDRLTSVTTEAVREGAAAADRDDETREEKEEREKREEG